MQRFRGGLVFKAHRLLYHSTLGLRVIKKKRELLQCDVPKGSVLENVVAVRRSKDIYIYNIICIYIYIYIYIYMVWRLGLLYCDVAKGGVLENVVGS